MSERPKPLAGKVAIITGASRGIGAETALAFVEAGADVIGCYVDPNKARRAARVEQQAGGKLQMVLADVTDPSGRKAMLDAALAKGRGLDVLVLNAAGGLEKDKEEGWARKINVDSSRDFVDEALPHMNPQGVVEYVTSLWAHRYGEVRQLLGYDPVASTKNEAEAVLRSKISELQDRNVRLGVNVGHIIKGTAAYSLFKIYDGGLPAEERFLDRMELTATGGVFPEARDMGLAAVELVQGEYGQGATMYVGGTRAEFWYPDGVYYGPKAVESIIPHRKPFQFLKGGVEVDHKLGAAVAWLEDLRKPEYVWLQSHFPGFPIVPGAILQEALAEVGAVGAFSREEYKGKIGVMAGVDNFRFKGLVRPGDDVRLTAELHSMRSRLGKGRLVAFMDDKIVTEGEMLVGIIDKPKELQ